MVKKILFILLLAFGFLIKNEQLIYATAPVAEISQNIDGKTCGFFTGCTVAGKDVTVKLSSLTYPNGAAAGATDFVKIDFICDGTCFNYSSFVQLSNKAAEFTVPGGKIATGNTYHMEISLISQEDALRDGAHAVYTSVYTGPSSQPVQAECPVDECNEDLNNLNSNLYELCAQIKTDTPQYSACMSCFLGQGIWTAIGCIPSNPQKIIQTIITIGLALGGGIVLIMILAGSFMLSVSQGDPNKTKEAKEMITSAIIGLLFVIFSVTILQFIGVSILHIPGFGE